MKTARPPPDRRRAVFPRGSARRPGNVCIPTQPSTTRHTAGSRNTTTPPSSIPTVSACFRGSCRVSRGGSATASSVHGTALPDWSYSTGSSRPRRGGRISRSSSVGSTRLAARLVDARTPFLEGLDAARHRRRRPSPRPPDAQRPRARPTSASGGHVRATTSVVARTSPSDMRAPSKMTNCASRRLLRRRHTHQFPP